MIFYDIIVIGAGASGITAAIHAKDLGKNVALLESTQRMGNKILTTGNGRCNISNSSITAPYSSYSSSTKNFFSNTLDNFTVDDTKNFFLSLGLPLIELENGKLFPKSLQASSVVDILKMAVEEHDIPIYYNNKVKSIKKHKNFVIETDTEVFTANKIVLACGGKTAVKTGSDGSGFKLAKSLGHSIISPIPGIVQLKLEYPHLKALSGTKINGLAKVNINDKTIRQEKGEILFTDYGISGPPIMQISSLVSKALLRKQQVEIELDMMPDLSQKEVFDFILNHFAMFPMRSIKDILIGIINKKLIPTLLKDIGIQSIHCTSDDIPWDKRNELCKRLKSWTFKCIDTNGFNNAQLTVGGVDCKEVNKVTLESNLVKGLYFCGEILDVNGDCGGFNLQWAWSSGYVSASHACK